MSAAAHGGVGRQFERQESGCKCHTRRIPAATYGDCLGGGRSGRMSFSAAVETTTRRRQQARAPTWNGNCDHLLTSGPPQWRGIAVPIEFVSTREFPMFRSWITGIAVSSVVCGGMLTSPYDSEAGHRHRRRCCQSGYVGHGYGHQPHYAYGQACGTSTGCGVVTYQQPCGQPVAQYGNAAPACPTNACGVQGVAPAYQHSTGYAPSGYGHPAAPSTAPANPGTGADVAPAPVTEPAPPPQPQATESAPVPQT